MSVCVCPHLYIYICGKGAAIIHTWQLNELQYLLYKGVAGVLSNSTTPCAHNLMYVYSPKWSLTKRETSTYYLHPSLPARIYPTMSLLHSPGCPSHSSEEKAHAHARREAMRLYQPVHSYHMPNDGVLVTRGCTQPHEKVVHCRNALQRQRAHAFMIIMPEIWVSLPHCGRAQTS